MNAGLLYEDVLIETEEVKLALSRLPKDVLNAREQRLKRAMVLSSQSKRVCGSNNAKFDLPCLSRVADVQDCSSRSA